jgi:predicted ATPase
VTRHQCGCSSPKSSHLRFISQSSLLDAFVQRYASGKVLVARGRFEEFVRVSDNPLSAIGQAFNGLLEQLLERGELTRLQLHDEWEELIFRSVQDIDGMSTLLPVIERMKHGEQSAIKKNVLSVNAIRIGLTRLLRNISCRLPVLLIFDDMHLATGECLELIASLISFEHFKQLMLIGTHRPLSDNNPLSIWKKRLGFLRLIDIELGPLQREEVSSVIERILRRDGTEVAPLVELVLHKTGGNIASVIEFLRRLEKQSLLFYDMSACRCRWDWNLEYVCYEC